MEWITELYMGLDESATAGMVYKKNNMAINSRRNYKTTTCLLMDFEYGIQKRFGWMFTDFFQSQCVNLYSRFGLYKSLFKKTYPHTS